MARGNKHAPEQIVSLLLQVEVAGANGKTTPVACRDGGITEQTYYRWPKEYGGSQVDQARRLEEFELITDSEQPSCPAGSSGSWITRTVRTASKP